MQPRARRPGFGKEALRPLKLLANHFPIVCKLKQALLSQRLSSHLVCICSFLMQVLRQINDLISFDARPSIMMLLWHQCAMSTLVQSRPRGSLRATSSLHASLLDRWILK